MLRFSVSSPPVQDRSLIYVQFNLACSGSEPISLNCRIMGTLVYLVCIAVASFAVLAQTAVAQEVNTNLPLTYPGRVLQESSSLTCPSEEQ